MTTAVADRSIRVNQVARLLALDTSTWWGGVALVEDEPPGRSPRLVAELGVHVERSHAGQLLPWVDWVLARAGWAKSDLDGYVATRGPGSFTGIRIGLGTIRGLALAAGRPCAGVSVLEALAEAHGAARGGRVALIGAGRGEVYGQRFDASASPPLPAEEPWLRPLERVAQSCGGEGVALLAPENDELAQRLRQEGLQPVTPRGVAAAAGRLACLRGFPASGESASLAPLYIRPPDATKPRR